MKVYTYSDARQQLARVLEEASLDGEVIIKKRDGQSYIVKPLKGSGSPLDVPGVSSDISLDEIINVVRESREPRLPLRSSRD
jgi:hypothetical protein